MNLGIREIGALLLLDLAEIVAPSQRTKIACIRARTAYTDATIADILEEGEQREIRRRVSSDPQTHDGRLP